jgi:hypothetical protein
MSKTSAMVSGTPKLLIQRAMLPGEAFARKSLKSWVLK